MITGASSGIGAGVATAFAKEGAQVIINYPNDEEEENEKEEENENQQIDTLLKEMEEQAVIHDASQE